MQVYFIADRYGRGPGDLVRRLIIFNDRHHDRFSHVKSFRMRCKDRTVLSFSIQFSIVGNDLPLFLLLRILELYLYIFFLELSNILISSKNLLSIFMDLYLLNIYSNSL